MVEVFNSVAISAWVALGIGLGCSALLTYLTIYVYDRDGGDVVLAPFVGGLLLILAAACLSIVLPGSIAGSFVTVVGFGCLLGGIITAVGFGVVALWAMATGQWRS